MKVGFSAKAPAKLIISGEHAIVYGAPAIAMAINQYLTTTVKWSRQNTINPVINFNLLAFRYAKSHTLRALALLANRLQKDYKDFLDGRCSIREVIKRPFELLQYSVINLIEKLQLQLSSSLDIQVDSNVPIGSGLGSSAAVIVSCLRSLAHLFKIKWEPTRFLRIGTDLENLQHGKSSGIDLHMSTFGGCAYFDNTFKAHKIELSDLSFQIIDTGIPLATTGECVSFVKDCFVRNSILLQDFSNVTDIIKQALLTNNKTLLLDAIKRNQELLCSIGVVPSKVQAFIKEIECLGGAAKICGAGSIYGDQAGALLLIGNQDKIANIAKVAANYNYKIQDVKIDHNGVNIV